MQLSKITASIVASMLAVVAIAVSAHNYTVGTIDIGHPNARPTRAGQVVGGGYLQLTNRGAADRLVSASAAEVAASVEMHSMSMDGDVMRMRQLDAIELPAGQTVELKSGGYHLMLIGLKAPLTLGGKSPMTLTFEKAGAVVVTVNIEEAKPAAAAAGSAAAPASAAAHMHTHPPAHLPAHLPAPAHVH
jgi:periplasmic copper chaperone A